MISSLGIDINPDDINEVFECVTDTSSINSHQKFWLYHSICGAFTNNIKSSIDGLMALKNKHQKKWQESLNKKQSILSTVISSLKFMTDDEYHIPEINSLNQLEDTSAELLDLLARCFLDDNKFDEALFCYDIISKKIGPDPLVSSKKAALYFSLGKISEANTELLNTQKMILTIFPDSLIPYENSEKDLHQAIKAGSFDTEFNKSFWGDKKKVVGNWFDYLNRFKSGNRYSNVGNEINASLENAITETFNDDSKISTVINYGTYCAYPDYQWSLKHPNRSFIGYDRDSHSIEINRNTFKSKNLSFFDGELCDCLNKAVSHGNGSTMLCHVRAFTEMTPAKIEQIYTELSKKKVKWVVGTEQYGPNIVSGRYFDTKNTNLISSIITSGTVSHNYETLLDRAGYEMVKTVDKPILGYHYISGSAFPLLAILSCVNFRSYRARLRS